MQTPGLIVGMLAGYVLLALLSLQLLPISSFIDTLSFWGIFDFANGIFLATPEHPWYSLAAANRLVLFCLLILLLIWTSDAESLYKRFFIGCAFSVPAASLLGVLNEFDIISLAWYRPKFFDASGVDRLHSVFGNPGWYAEYVLICTPFVLLLFGRNIVLKARLFILTAILLLVGTSLLLTGSRTGWLFFPWIAFFCYVILLIVDSAKNEQSISRQNICRSFVKVSLGGICICLVFAAVFLVVNRSGFPGSDTGSLTRTQYTMQRIRNIAVLEERGKVWPESLAMVSESPIYGLGYESYRWHKGVMATVPDSRYAQQRRTTTDWDTAHNIYIQLAVSNGVVGLIVWFALVFFVALLLWQDGVTNRNTQSFALLAALLGFHLYGFAQSMQYVASIWFIMFMLTGYATLLDRRQSTAKLVRLGRYSWFFALLVAVSGGVVYGRNIQSQKLAERYDLSRYEQDRGEELYKGFYWREDWGKDGYFRWSGRKAEIMLSRSGRVQFDIACYAPQLDRLPLTVEISLNDQPLDSYTFQETKKVTRTYVVPAAISSGFPARLRLQLSRTWSPKREGMGNDSRNLGVAVSVPRYLDHKTVKDNK